MKGIFIVAMLIAGYMDSSCLWTAALVKEIDSFSGVKYNPYHGNVLHSWLSRMSKHSEYCQNAGSKIKC